MKEYRKNIGQYRKWNINAMFICMAGIGLNILLGMLVAALGLPLYLDTVGTVVVAVLGGYLPGAIVGFTTNIIKSFSDYSSLYYGVLNILIAIAATYLAGRGWFKKFGGILGACLVFTFIGGGLGALIPWFMEGLTFDSESLSGILYATGIFNPAVSHLLSSLIMDLPDKALTVAIVMGIIHLIPKKYHRYFYFSMWMQIPIQTEKKEENDKKRIRVMSLRAKALLVLIVALTAVALVGTIISMKVYHKSLVHEHTQMAQGTAKLATTILDGDRINGYLENAENAKSMEDYQKTLKQLTDVLYSSTEIAYLYVYQMQEDGFHVVFDIETEDTPAGEIGSVLPYDDGFTPYIPSLLTGQEVEPIITNDEYGHLLTAAMPVFDSEGNCVCYAIADVDMERLAVDERSFLVEMITIFLSFFILICAFVMWLTDYHIIFPMESLTRNIDTFSTNGDSQQSLDDEVKRFRSLDIHTGDEIENLYHSICQMTKNQSEQMRSIRRLSESTEKMQDGLIITMADMVENRDEDTGAHIQKTAAYVDIIVRGLKEKGYYAEKLTPKFMSDVVRSAPLHDVGKIHISDKILNKPGKLTDEEYEIMKTHTTAGKKIMERAISTVKGDNYLMEAMNMAAYHHERWDGKGYPEGLHGEVIPLSARIMAVADVFDALTSERVYKKAFPIDKAIAIMEEGKGTQFDPKCIEVFVEALDDVKNVLSEFQKDVVL